MDAAVTHRSPRGIAGRQHHLDQDRGTDAKKRAPADTQKQWVILPHENGNFVAAMEDVLEVYQRPFEVAEGARA
jgi:hypothetical protein